MVRIADLRRLRAGVGIAVREQVLPRTLTTRSRRSARAEEGCRALALVSSRGKRPMSPKSLSAIVLSATLLWVMSCSRPIKGELQMRVELQVYSGRPNPSWELSAPEVAELAKRMTALPRSRQPFVQGGLGYGGFVIQNQGKAAGLPPEIHVFNGIGIPERSGITAYQDAHDLEGWLLEQTRQHGHGAILSEIGQHGPR